MATSITHVNSTTATTASGSTVTIAKPGSLADGDVLLAIIATDDSSPSFYRPEGWDYLGGQPATNRSVWAWIRPVTSASGEPSTYSWFMDTASGDHGGIIVALRGVETAAILDATVTFGSGINDTSPDSPAITTGHGDAMAVAIVAMDDGDVVFTAPSGFTNAATDNSSGLSVVAAYGDMGAAGAKGPFTWGTTNAAATTDYVAMTVAFGEDGNGATEPRLQVARLTASALAEGEEPTLRVARLSASVLAELDDPALRVARLNVSVLISQTLTLPDPPEPPIIIPTPEDPVIDEGPPPTEVVDIIEDPITRIARMAMIFHQDGETPYIESVGILGGEVRVDASSTEERRSFTLELHNEDGQLTPHQDAFWYDKVVKLWRGVWLSDTSQWVHQLGTFMIDTIEHDHLNASVRLAGRDYTKKLLVDKFAAPTTFVRGTSLDEFIRGVGAHALVLYYNLPWSSGDPAPALGKDFTFDADTPRWDAIRDVCAHYGFDAYFNPKGELTVVEYQDPSTSPTKYTFQTGPIVGNIADIQNREHDERLCNHVVVRGETASGILVWDEVEVGNPDSPIHPDRLGVRRTKTYVSSMFTTVDQCRAYARRLLDTSALRSSEAALETLVIPWLEGGDIIEFLDPNAFDDDPTSFFLHDFTIPVGLGTMQMNVNRVTVVD